MEHRFSITLAELGRSEYAVEQLRGAFVTPELGPMVSTNTRSGELSITWARGAYECSTPIFADGIRASGAAEVPPVRIEVQWGRK